MRNLYKISFSCALLAWAGCADNPSGGAPEAFMPFPGTGDGGVEQTVDPTTVDPTEDPGSVVEMDAAVPDEDGMDPVVVEPPEACTGEICEIFTCRFKALNGADACTDYYGHHGWTAQSASEHCQLPDSMTTEHRTPVAEPDQDPCAVGGLTGDGSSMFEDTCATTMGSDKPYLSYGAPQAICESAGILAGTYTAGATAPLCEPGVELPCNEDASIMVPDAGMEEPEDAGMVDETADGITYNCQYTNPLANDDAQCRQYNGSWNATTAEADCNAHPIGAGMTFGTGACPAEGQHGYCTTQRGDQEVAYTGGCDDDPDVNNGVWACKNFGDTDDAGNSIAGTWTCLLTAPPYRCSVADAADGAVACRDFAPGTSEADANADCDGGTVEEGDCDGAGAVATCTEGGTVEYIAGDDTGDCDTAEPNCSGTFECLVSDPTVWTCQVEDTGLGCTLVGGDYTCAACVDFPAANGFDQASAQAGCEAYRDSLGQDGATIVGDSVTEGQTSGCERDFFCLNADGSRLYSETDPDGVVTPASVDECPPLGCDATTAEVITCRYTSNPFATITADICIDFLAADGWTVEMVDEQCRNNGDNPTSEPVITGCNTCLDASPDADRCVGTRASDNRSFYAYDTPQIACDNIEGGELQSPPHAAY